MLSDPGGKGQEVHGAPDHVIAQFDLDCLQTRCLFAVIPLPKSYGGDSSFALDDFPIPT